VFANVTRAEAFLARSMLQRVRSLFWPLIALASLLEAAAAACLAAAAFSNPIPRGSTTYGPTSTTEVFGRPASLSWSIDRGMLIASIGLAVAGLLTYALAARVR
jgi:hypothetical protein